MMADSVMNRTRPWAVVAFVCSLACGSFAQTLAEQNAAMGGMDELTGGATVGPPATYVNRAQNVAGGAPAGALPNPSGGFSAPPMAGLPGLPGVATPTPLGGYPGLTSPGTMAAPGAAGPGQPMQAVATPLPTIKVLVGKRVTCSVCGALLEDAYQLDVLLTQQDNYQDDGIVDNGIPNDGIRGNVETIKNVYIGPECNTVKNQLVNLVRHAERLTPHEFYRYHVMSLNPSDSRPDMPNMLEKEQQRDESLRDWNNKFLADYRVDKNDPKSEFYQLYVPDPPQVPRYPVPPGYVAPQKLREGNQPGQPNAGPTPNIFNGDPVMGEGLI